MSVLDDNQKENPREDVIGARPPASRKRGIRERLLPGEHVVEQAVISNFIFWRATAVFIIAILVALFIAQALGILLAGAAVLMAIYAILLKEILFLAVTNKRVLARYGILQVDIVDIHFDKVESIELKRMLTGYLMGYSDVVIMGTGLRYIVVPFVANGIMLRRAYNDLTLSHPEETPPMPVVIVSEDKQNRPQE